MIVYQCPDSMEGILTAIYDIYADGNQKADAYISLAGETFLFAEYKQVLPDRSKSEKVLRTLKRRFGGQDSEWICLALASEDSRKAQAVYRTVARGLAEKKGVGGLFDAMADDDVNLAYKLGQRSWHEYHHLMGFVRFEELEGRILYAKIGPKSNLLPFLMPHFEDRLSIEHFMIYDECHDLLGLHVAGQSWYLMEGCGDPKTAAGVCVTEDEKKYQELFRFFCHRITIEERKNPALQQQLLPLRFREYMTEWKG